MPKMPRNLSGRELAHALERLGYVFMRQSGSHMRYQTEVRECMGLPSWTTAR